MIAFHANSATDSELFGHAPGVLSSTTSEQIGSLKLAQHGTCYIDEVAELSKSGQEKLLRLLESGRLAPLGSSNDEPLDVRIIAGTADDLDLIIAHKRISHRLYCCLSTIEIYVPPLRLRRADIGWLVSELGAELSAKHGMPPPRIESDLMRFFEQFSWPGNIRQLRDCLEDMLVNSHRDTLCLADLSGNKALEELSTIPAAPHPQDRRWAQLERSHIADTLRQHGNNRSRTAQALGISVRTLQRKLKKWERQGDPIDGAHPPARQPD
jgi:DNA-binding NtrC family response regulator